MPTFAVTITDASAEFDAQAAELAVSRENERRAALEPPGTPLAISPLPALKTSYEVVCGTVVLPNYHTSMKAQASGKLWEDFRERVKISSRAQIAAALAALQELP